ncbi:MAG: DUF2829 domain-containing protein [Candidatus Methanofastidiosum sp.]|nr:DUF2829 domain-containing protein [Methanofastidiosum sp.]
MTNLPFDCVVKALRIGRKSSREAWTNPNEKIYIIDADDKGNKKVVILTNNTQQDYFASSEDILARDWYIVE